MRTSAATAQSEPRNWFSEFLCKSKDLKCTRRWKQLHRKRWKREGGNWRQHRKLIIKGERKEHTILLRSAAELSFDAASHICLFWRWRLPDRWSLAWRCDEKATSQMKQRPTPYELSSNSLLGRDRARFDALWSFVALAPSVNRKSY